jgi:hypothetical protein
VYKGVEAQQIPEDVHNRLMVALQRRCRSKTTDAGK